MPGPGVSSRDAARLRSLCGSTGPTRAEYDAEKSKRYRDALARGDILAVEHHVTDALAAFWCQSRSGRVPPTTKLRHCGGRSQSYVRALQAIGQRNAGEPVETPKSHHGDARYARDWRDTSRCVRRLEQGASRAAGTRLGNIKGRRDVHSTARRLTYRRVEEVSRAGVS